VDQRIDGEQIVAFATKDQARIKALVWKDSPTGGVATPTLLESRS